MNKHEDQREVKTRELTGEKFCLVGWWLNERAPVAAGSFKLFIISAFLLEMPVITFLSMGMGYRFFCV
jgi:hypothetical protein